MASWEDLLNNDGTKIYVTIKPQYPASWFRDLQNIANKAGVTVDEIVALNPDIFSDNKYFPQNNLDYTPILIGETTGPVIPPDPPTDNDVFSYPTNQSPLMGSSYYISQEYGSGGHGGTDLAAAVNTPVKAVQYGTVRTVQSWDGSTTTGNQSWGNMIILQHQGEQGSVFYTLYAHLNNSPTLKIGSVVSKGDIIGYVGTTGNSTGYHLHIEVWQNGYGTAYRTNPKIWIPL